jgi:hypothetical protein
MRATGIDEKAADLARRLCWWAVLAFSAFCLESCSSRVGTSPPPLRDLEYVEGEVTGCRAGRTGLRGRTKMIVFVQVDRTRKHFVGAPDVEDEVFAACMAVWGMSAKFGYSSKSYVELKLRELNPSLPRVRRGYSRLGNQNHPYVWDISLNGRPVLKAGHGSLSRKQARWNLFMMPIMPILAVIAWIAYLNYVWQPKPQG